MTTAWADLVLFFSLFYFEIILAELKSCNNSPENSGCPSPSIPKANISMTPVQ